MDKYRKKPVVVDAWRVPARGEAPSDELIDLVQENGWIGDDEGILIQTLEGDMLALPNDWIIKGVAGEFYPCKPDIFEARMSSWRFQVMQHVDDNGEPFYAIHEFYTMHDGGEGWTQRPVPIEAESISDLRMTLLNILRDLERHGIRDAKTGSPLI